MSQVIKSFTGVFFLLLVVLLGTGILSAQMDASNAISYKADLVAELENSNYSAQVINGCIAQAIEMAMGFPLRHTPRVAASVCTPPPRQGIPQM